MIKPPAMRARPLYLSCLSSPGHKVPTYIHTGTQAPTTPVRAGSYNDIHIYIYIYKKCTHTYTQNICDCVVVIAFIGRVQSLKLRVSEEAYFVRLL